MEYPLITPNFKTVEFVIGSAVADDGTFTVQYPEDYGNGDFENAAGHYIVLNGDRLEQPHDIGISFGTSNITVTNRTGGTLEAGTGHMTLVFGGEKAQDLVARAYTGDDEVEKRNVMVDASRLHLLRVNFGAPAASDTDGIASALSATDSAQSYDSTDFVSAFDGELDVPRNLTVKGTTGSNHVVTITGEDVYGQPMSENITLSGTTTVAGAKAFKKVSTVDVAAGAAGDTFDIGWGDVLGLPVRVERTSDILMEFEDGAKVGDFQAINGTAVAGLAKDTEQTATTADPRGTYDAASAMDGDLSVELWVAVSDATDIGNKQYVAG